MPNEYRDWYFIAEPPAPATHLAHPEGCAALRIVLLTVPRVSCSCENFPDELDLHLLHDVRSPHMLLLAWGGLHSDLRLLQTNAEDACARQWIQHTYVDHAILWMHGLYVQVYTCPCNHMLHV